MAETCETLAARMLTVSQAAKYLALSERSIWKAAAAGRLPIRRFGRSVRIDKRALDRLIDGEGGRR